MLHPMRSLSFRAVCLALVVMFGACSPGGSGGKSDKKLAKQEKKREKAEKKKERASQGQNDQPTDANGSSSFASAGCDESLWNRVYDPSRLQKLAACITVKGTVEESAADDDGDQHFLVKLDPGQEALINKTNIKKKGGALVVEIVCANPVSLAKAKVACQGYRNTIAVPTVGEHLTVSGAYVIDSHNGWAEIHPVSKLNKS